jgi:hypothetical protein
MDQFGPVSATDATARARSTPSRARKAGSPPLGVTRVRTRETLTRPDIAQLIMRGARECGFPVPSAILAELALSPGDACTGIFVGSVSDEPCVVVIGFLPSSAFWLAATVSLAYSERAPRQLVALVAAKLRGWLKENGHNHVLVMNMLHSDRSYIKGLRHFGAPSRAGSVIRFGW